MSEYIGLSVIKTLPPNLANDPNVRMAATAFDECLKGIVSKIPNLAILSNLVLKQLADETLIDLLAWQFHVDFYDPDVPLTLEMKRELALKSLDWHTRKGTPSAVEEMVSTIFSDAIVVEWFEYGGNPYNFRIEMETGGFTERRLEHLITVVFAVKNTRSWFEGIILITKLEEPVKLGISGISNAKITETRLEEQLPEYKANLAIGTTAAEMFTVTELPEQK